MISRLQQLSALGQAIWLDNIDRDLLDSGRLHALVDEGLAGLTSNPSIFQKSIAAGDAYDEQIRDLAAAGKSPHDIYEALAVADIAAAADVLRPVYNETHGRDGFVSLEVRPGLAHDAQGTIDEARRLFETVRRPNLMIKVPATEAGLPAITTLIGEGINVNVTLIFSIEMYRRVIDAYIAGVELLSESKRVLSSTSSVASFFVSRLDTQVDRLLSERIAAGAYELEPLLGQAAVANAKLAYQAYKEVFEGARFAELRADGARVQRPLWASTSTKNPAYPDTKYVDALIGVNTVNTAPPATLDALRDHGVVAVTLEQDVAAARDVFDRLAAAGVDLAAVTDELLADGIDQFAQAFDRLITGIADKIARLAAS